MYKYLLIPCVLFGAFLAGCSSDSDEPDSSNDGKDPSEVLIPDAPPERDGMTVRGHVMSARGPVAGVVVSDGVEVTVTDNDGIYYLPSAKANGYVFMSVPSGYEAKLDVNTPQFWHKTAEVPDKNEVIDFTLVEADQSKVALMAFADFHLAKRTNDISQFAGFCVDANKTAESLKADGYAVYGISLGDESWDLYWYDNNYSYANAYTEIERLKMSFFHNMGNHDNNPYYASDRGAENSFRRKAGPTFYSFNAGEAHVVVIDNIEYKNAGGSIGHIGDRSYNVAFVSDILEWMGKDLATVTDKSKPLVVAMHAQFYKTARSVTAAPELRPVNGEDLLSLLAPFSSVTLLTGHVHENCNTDLVAGNGMEHNVAAVCGTWWWTGYMGGSHLCKDGSPGGYEVFMFDGKGSPTWYYKGSGHDQSYQFRAYDMNTVYIDPSGYADASKLSKYANGYDTKPIGNNRVLINVFNYDSGWTVSVTENGRELPVTRVAVPDPLHTLSYNCRRVAQNATPTSAFKTETTAHMFMATASGPTSTLTIKVTDRFGNVYTEQMQRPKKFDITMK